jgi:hypothetical protein
MLAKFSIISSLCRVRAFARKILIEYFAPSFFFFFCHGGFLWHVRAIFLKRDKFETQLSILGPRQGHALKKYREYHALIPLIQIIFGMK